MAAAMEIDEEDFVEPSTSSSVPGEKPGNKKRFEVKKVSPLNLEKCKNIMFITLTLM